MHLTRVHSPPYNAIHLHASCSGWKLNPMHWACSHHALGHATQQIQDGDDGQPAGAASASSVEGVRRGRSDIWPYPMARSASPAASAHVGKPLDSSSRVRANSGCWGGFAWAGPVRRCWQVAEAQETAVGVAAGAVTSGETVFRRVVAAWGAARVFYFSCMRAADLYSYFWSIRQH